MANACKYPPLGHRSIAGNQPMLRFETVPAAEATRLANAETLIVVMLETPTAIENVDAIAAVKGIDLLMIGTNDLCAEMGIHGQYGDPRISDAYKKVIAACRKHGKFPGMGGVDDPQLMEQLVGYGMRFILSGHDLSFLMSGARQRAEFLRNLPSRR